MQALDEPEPQTSTKSVRRTPAHRASKSHSWRRWVAGIVVGGVAALFVCGAILVTTQHLKLEPVLSGSMRPGIQPGDLAVIKPVPVADLKVGEVIAYLPPHETTPVLHRIVSINSNGIVTKGDANNVADPWGRVKPQDSTVERLVVTIPKVGFLTNIRQLMLIVAGVLLVVVAVVALWPEKRGKKDAEKDSDSSDATDGRDSDTSDGIDDPSKFDGFGDDDRDAVTEPDMEPELTSTKGE